MSRWLLGHTVVMWWEEVVNVGYISKEGLTGPPEAFGGLRVGVEPQRVAGNLKLLWDKMGGTWEGRVWEGPWELGVGMLSLGCLWDTQGEMLCAPVGIRV